MCVPVAFDVYLFVFVSFSQTGVVHEYFYGYFYVLAQRVKEVFKRHYLRTVIT